MRRKKQRRASYERKISSPAGVRGVRYLPQLHFFCDHVDLMKTPLLASLSLLALGLTSPLFAVDPPPGGGYSGNNTALGDDALLNLTTGTNNTALGFDALASTTRAATTRRSARRRWSSATAWA